MKSQMRSTCVCALGLVTLAAGGCSNYSRPFTMTSQPTTLIASDRLGGVMFDDHVALAQASRVAHAREIMVAAAHKAAERDAEAAAVATANEAR